MGTTFTGGGPHITIGAPATGGKAVSKVTPGRSATGGGANPASTVAPPKPKIPPKPANPAIGGHYVRLGGKWTLIHAVGPNKWATGPVPTVAPGVRADNPLLGNQPLTGAARYKAAQAIADAQTTEPISELTSQIAAQNRQTAGTMQTAGGYFNQLGQQAQQGVTDQTANTAALNAALQGIGQNTQTALQGIGTSAQDTLAKYAPQGEGGLNSAAVSSLAQEMARQQGLAAQQSGTAQGFGALQGANYGGLAASQLGTQALAGTAAIRGISQSGTVANAPLESKIAGLKAQRGSLLGTALGNLYQQNQANQITKLGLQAGVTKTAITQAGQTARTQATVGAANARNAATLAERKRESDRTFGLNSKKYGTSVANDLYDRQHGIGKYKLTAGSKAANSATGGVKPLATASQNALVTRIQKLSGNMQATLDWYTQRGYPLAKAQQLAYHAIKKGVAVGPGGQSHAVAHEADPLLLNAAYNNLSSRAGLTAGDVQSLAKKMGLTRLGSLRVANSRTSSLEAIQGALAPAANAFR